MMRIMRRDRFRLEMALERHVANAADHVIAITDGLRAQLIEWGIPEPKISLLQIAWMQRCSPFNHETSNSAYIDVERQIGCRLCWLTCEE